MLGAPSGAAAGVAGRAAAVPAHGDFLPRPPGGAGRAREDRPAPAPRLCARGPQLGRRASPWAPGCFSRNSGFSFQFLNQFLRIANSLGSLEDLYHVHIDLHHVHIDLHYVHIDLHINNGKQAFLPASVFYFKRFILG